MAEVTEEQSIDVQENDVQDADMRKRSPLVEAVRAPISEADPVGEDVKYEDSFQQLKMEVDKVQSANADADFDRIVELGKQVLTEQSKDLTAAAYLGIGLVRTAGLAGLADGIGIARVLCETYWDDLYPPMRRMVARKNALQLLTDRGYEFLDGYKPTKGEGERLEHALDDFKALQAFAMEQMGEHAPVLSRLAKLLETKLRAVPKDPPPAPPPAAGDGAAAATASTATASPAATAPPRAPAAGAAVAAGGEFQSPTQAKVAVLKAAAFLREQDATAPTPFRLARALRWGALVEPPPAQGGKTLVEPYIEQRKAYLSGLLTKGQFADLAAAAEESFLEHPFWLDLQRFLVTALDALGGPFAAIRDGVLGDLAVLVHRFPSLPSLAFSDGTPFADGPTQEWIETHVRSVLGGGEAASGAPTPTGDGGSAVETAYAEAREHLMKGDLAAAVGVLGEGTDASGRERFRRRLYLAALCVRGERPAVARPLLEGLEADVDAHRLDVWEPALALEVWTALHECYRALERGAEADRKAALGDAASRVFERVCAAAPGRALGLLGADGRGP
jgi:type VI secretion system protein VasJ